jgi:hypothetical protein
VLKILPSYFIAIFQLRFHHSCCKTQTHYQKTSNTKKNCQPFLLLTFSFIVTHHFCIK